MRVVRKARGLALGLGGCAVLVFAASGYAAPSSYTATRPVRGVAHTSVTVTTSTTASTVTIVSTNAKVLADAAGRRLVVHCAAANDSLMTAGVSMLDVNFGVWRRGSSSLRVTLTGPLISGRALCGADVQRGAPGLALQASFDIAAPAPTSVERAAKADLDPATSFQLIGNRLTVTSTNPEFLKTVQNRTVYGLCSAGAATSASWQKTSSATDRGRVVAVSGPHVRWAAGAGTATITLPDDISQDVDICQLGPTPIKVDGVGAPSYVPPYVRASFDAAGAESIARDRATELSQIRQALEQSYREANADRAGARNWPAAKTLVKALDHHLGPYPLYAASISAVAQPEMVYVVGDETHGATLEFAALDRYGVMHTLSVSIGGQIRISADLSGRI